jgi:superoxide oxidase
MPKLQQQLAKASEYALYALLLLQPLTGLGQSLARGRGFTLFVRRVPSVTTGNRPLTALFHEIHELSAWFLLGLIGLHILAALFHRSILRDEVLESMLPWRRKGQGATRASHIAIASAHSPPASSKM